MSTRKIIIKIMEGMIRQDGQLMEYDRGRCSPQELALLTDLIKLKYLDGAHQEDSNGVPFRAMIRRMTLDGHLYLDEIKRREFDKSLLGKLSKMLKYVAAYLLGLLAPLITRWVSAGFGLE